jgi:hypothetical protein
LLIAVTVVTQADHQLQPFPSLSVKDRLPDGRILSAVVLPDTGVPLLVEQVADRQGIKILPVVVR